MKRTLEARGEGQMTMAHKARVHKAWTTPDGQEVNLCGVLAKRGRSRTHDDALVTCDKCRAKETK